MIGGKAPSLYLKQIQEASPVSQDEMDKILASHLIDPSLLRADNFNDFNQARKAALLEVIANAMGKPLIASGGEALVEDAEDQDEDDSDASP